MSTTAVSGFSGSINLSVTGLPTGATGTFNPTSVCAGSSSALSITTTWSTPAGTYTLTITGTSGTLTQTAKVTLVVTPESTSNCASPTSVGAYTFCGEAYNDVDSSNTVSVSYNPYAGNGIEVIGTWCENASCSAAPGETATLSDNVNSPETCFTISPHSPYNFANTAVPDYGRVYAWYCPSIPSGVNTFTMTVSGTVCYTQIAVVEWLTGSISPSNFFESVDGLSASGNRRHNGHHSNQRRHNTPK